MPQDQHEEWRLSGFSFIFMPKEAATSRLTVNAESSKWIPQIIAWLELGDQLGRCRRTKRTHWKCLFRSFLLSGKWWIETLGLCWVFPQLSPFGPPATHRFPLIALLEEARDSILNSLNLVTWLLLMTSQQHNSHSKIFAFIFLNILTLKGYKRKTLWYNWNIFFAFLITCLTFSIFNN